jgi:cytochrome c
MRLRFCDALDTRLRSRSAIALMFALLAVAPAQSRAATDVTHGAEVYRDCMLCHSLDRNEIGPRHRGVFGRQAGSVPDYDYSAALKASGIVWNEATLDRWLTDPSALVPGTKMIFSLDDARDRADVIAFLKEQSARPPNTAAGAK